MVVLSAASRTVLNACAHRRSGVRPDGRHIPKVLASVVARRGGHARSVSGLLGGSCPLAILWSRRVHPASALLAVSLASPTDDYGCGRVAVAALSAGLVEGLQPPAAAPSAGVGRVHSHNRHLLAVGGR